MLPREALRDAVASALAETGRTIRQVEADEARGRARDGDAAQGAHRDRPVWHTKREIDAKVARLLRLDPSVCGPRRRSNELQTAVAGEIARLRRSGALADWNSARRFNTFRAAAGSPPPPPRGLSMSIDERPDAAARAPGGSMWDDLVAILRRGRRDNTYKFALARALIELCSEGRRRGEGAAAAGAAMTIPYGDLAEKFVRYYWHQEYRFRMRQDFHTRRPPRVIAALREVWGEGAHPGDFGSLDAGDVRRAEGLVLRGVFGRYQPIYEW